MQKPEIPKIEKERLKELNAYHIFDACEEEDFDFLTAMASEICGSKMAVISVVADDKQCFLSHHGLDIKETPREISFCAHAINTPDQPFIIADARLDHRFFDNPVTTGGPFVIFYAGIPLVNSNGFALGTLCVMDDKPGQLNDDQLVKLKHLARLTVKLLELRRSQIELKQANEALEQFAYVAAHDLKEPLRGITTYLSIFKKNYSEQLDEKAFFYIDNAFKNAQRMKNLITDILDFSRTGAVEMERVDLNELLDAVFANYNLDNQTSPVKLNKTNLPKLNSDASSLIQVLTNLIDNAIKYQPEGNIAEIKVDAETGDTHWTIIVADNGIGIDPVHQEKVFEIFKRLHNESQYSGTGIGLANCKKIITALGGKIWFEANKPSGTIFKFTLPKI